MGSISDGFNRSGFSKFINSRGGRIFRLVAGLIFLLVGIILIDSTFGIILIIWSVVPLSSTALDLCYISAVLGGPVSSKKIRERYPA
ncbi:MAG TPA: hypothetical protein VLY03_07135 [Bacteroidota bacterium]|nr:hypothetical protein [Bacteroidota bacterium]